MELLTVGEMARRARIPATTLRYYDGLGLLEPVRLANSHRRYPVEMVERVQLIKLCQELGAGLDEIRGLLEPEAREARRLAARRELIRIDRQLQKLAIVKDFLTHFAECACTDTSACQATIRAAVSKLVE